MWLANSRTDQLESLPIVGLSLISNFRVGYILYYVVETYTFWITSFQLVFNTDLLKSLNVSNSSINGNTCKSVQACTVTVVTIHGHLYMQAEPVACYFNQCDQFQPLLVFSFAIYRPHSYIYWSFRLQSLQVTFQIYFLWNYYDRSII